MSGRFEITETALAGVYVLQRAPIEDERGWLERMYSKDDFAQTFLRHEIVDINRSRTRSKGTVRGLHYQLPPSAEAKVVSCLRGEVFDVAVDLRRGSPTFLRWHAERLAEHNRRSLVIPEGVAHGFQTLVDDCDLLYFHTAAYDSASERRVNPMEARVSVAWPLSVARISERDSSAPALAADFDGIVV